MAKKILLLSLFFFISVVQIIAQVTLTSSNLPIVVINTNGQTIPDDPKITASMGIIFNGPGNRNNISDPFNAYDGKIGIEIRGHSSQMFNKKQYGIELRDQQGNDIKVGLLGMPEESDFVLNASYIDKTLLRNVLTYKISNDMGRYASRTQYCELIINGDYRGIYILQEKVKRDKNRINIKKMSANDISGDPLTGGYIVKIDRVDPGDKYWTSPYAAVIGSNKAPVTYIHEYPKAADILPEQQNYIKNYITMFEKIMFSSLFKDPFAGYYNYIDIDSFVDYYLINEFSKNTDAYRLSAFMYKDRDSENGKLVMGPVWDYDISYGLADYDDGYNPSGWQALKHYEDLWSAPFWTTNLMMDPVFKNKLAKRWHELKNNILSISTINNFIDQNVTYLAEARERNFTKWNDLFNPLVYTWPNKNRFTSYQQEINYLKSWISQRINWLNNNLPDNYSSVDWKQIKLSNYNFETGKEKIFALNLFASNLINITSLKVVSLSADVEFKLQNDTLYIKVLKAGKYSFKILGMNGAETVSISPEYNITNVTTSIDTQDTSLPSGFQLFQNYPNPFNPATVIKYTIPNSGFVTLKVFNTLGIELATLVNEEKFAGEYEIKFDASKMASGIYFYRLQTGKFTEIKKMILIK
ncbi:MAG: T9SS type A sorting domain-containing protein [Ignavibacteria bacterium]|nr:T9SS type A sorting domain-containing protein [Ignavibacteria bacterium]